MMQGLSFFEQSALWGICAISLMSVAYAFYLRALVLKEPVGDKEMQKIWLAISDGAKAYLSQQLRKMHPIMGLLAVLLFLSVYIIPPSKEAMERFAAFQDPNTVNLIIGLSRVIAFAMGSMFSLSVGQIGMRMAVKANVRVTQAARTGFSEAFHVPGRIRAR